MTEIYPNIILRIIFINYPDHRHHPDERATCTQFAHKAFPLENLEKGNRNSVIRNRESKSSELQYETGYRASSAMN
ncbi:MULTISPECIES: hypothetical protein [Sphingobium]|uniref:Uncharacterized protein n=1 Tax=Sphingobium agri TaxID=2933566 RepID=A0ABT0E1Q5_9SPHN|nr:MULTISPECIES: hypothetical protein [Sphingobium]MCK0533293.1 hypothetical protein [Sphingobium agri]QPI73316.1 hypothetical protein IZV00_02050 [Sphingobium sp. Cam5-1]